MIAEPSVYLIVEISAQKSCSTLNEGNSFKLFVVFRVSRNAITQQQQP